MENGLLFRLSFPFHFEQITAPTAFHQQIGRLIAFGERLFKQRASVQSPFERQISVCGFEALKIGRYLNEYALLFSYRRRRWTKRLARNRRVDQWNALGHQRRSGRSGAAAAQLRLDARACDAPIDLEAVARQP